MSGVAGANQLSQKDFIQVVLFAAELFGLEELKSICAQRAHGLSFAPGLQIGGAKFGGALFFGEFLVLALGDGFLGLVQD